MDFSHPTNKETTPKKKWPFLKKLLVSLSSIILLLLLLLLCLPMLLSTSFIRHKTLETINKKIAPATLSIESWSFAWSSQQYLKGITYKDSSHGIESSINIIEINSLLGLLPLGKITADLRIDTPIVNVYAPVPVTSSITTTENQSNTPAVSATTTAPTFNLPTWDIAAHLRIEHATVSHYLLTTPLLNDSTCDILLPSFRETSTVKIMGTLLDAPLSFEASLLPLEQALVTPTYAVETATLIFNAPWLSINTQLRTHKQKIISELALTSKLPVLMQQLNAFGVHPKDFDIKDGTLNLKTKVDINDFSSFTAKPTLAITTDVTTSPLSIVYAGKTLQAQPEIKIQGTLPTAHPLEANIQNFSILLPGIDINAKGQCYNGIVDGQIDVNEVLSLLKPLTGIEPLVKPLKLTLSGISKPTASSLKFNAISKNDTLATLAFSLKGEQLNLTSSYDLTALAPFLNIAQQIGGKAFFNASTVFSNTETQKAKILFALQDARIKTAAWDIQQPSLLNGSMELAYQKDNRALTLSQLKLDSPAFTLIGKGNIPKDLQFEGSLYPEIIWNQWHIQAKDAPSIRFHGEVPFSLTFQQLNNNLPQFSVQSTPKTLAIDYNDEQIICPFDLAINAHMETAQSLILDAFNFISPYVEMVAKGNYQLDAHSISLSGDLTPDFAKLWTLPMCKPYHENFAITGKNKRAFTFESPLEAGLTSIRNYGKGHAEIAFDKITVPGLDIPHGTFTTHLSEGVLQLDAIVAVNQGSINLTPRINVANTPMLITFPENTKLLDSVALTTDLLNVALKYVNPLLPNSATATGSIDFILQNFRMELTDKPLANATAEAYLKLQGCTLQPNDTLSNILAFSKIKNHTATLPDQNLHLQLTDGKITSDPIEIEAKPLKLSCEGVTNLGDGTLDYTVTIPVTAELLGQKLSKYMNATTLSLPISGPIAHPRIDLSNISNLFQNVGTTAVNSLLSNVSKKLDKKANKTTSEQTQVNEPSQDTSDKLDLNPLADSLNSLWNRKKKK